MATSQKAAAPKAAKKSQGFTGIRGAFWIIVLCFIAALCIFNLWLGNGANFQGGDNANAPANIFGTIYKGGYVVPIIHTLLLTVLCLAVERYFALKTAFGKGSLTKFVANIKAALAANDFDKAEDLCNKMQGSVANVVLASLHAYRAMESGANASLKKSQKVARIEQAHGGYSARDAYSADEPSYRRYYRNARYTYRTARYRDRYDSFIPGSGCWWWR